LPESTRSSTRADERLWAVVLAGGIGSRFWPASTPDRPKQLLRLASDQPLIADTVDRALALVDKRRLKVLAAAHLVEQFKTLGDGWGDELYWTEPQARGTCPVLAWAAWEIHRQDPDAVMVSLHADHRIEPVGDFVQTIAAAVQLARTEDLLLCIGAEPDRVESAFGHIEPGEPLLGQDAPAAYRVSAFHEKPDVETAERYVRQGYLWNTGIFVWKASTFLDEVRLHAPDVGRALPLLEQGPDAFFDAAPSCVVDTAVMERSSRVGVVRSLFSWDDVGSWEALSRTREPDDAGNFTIGDGTVVSGSGNIVFAEGGRVVLFGVEDTIVVRTGDTTLVMHRDRAPDLKQLLETLE
jgi:mannose-1-phosphate guanylyltransferase